MSKSIETIIDRTKKGNTSVEDLMEKQKAQRMAELEGIQVERMIEEEKKKLREAKGSDNGEAAEGQKVKRDFVTELLAMAQIDPKKAKDFLESLSEEDISKLALLGAGGGSNLSAFLALGRSPSSSVRDMIDVAKLLIQQQPQRPQESMGELFTGVAKLLEATKEKGGGAPSQAQQLTDIYEKWVKPLQDSITKLREEYATERMQALEAKIAEFGNRPSFAQELTAKHEELMALRDALGGGGGGQIPADIQVKLEDMRLTQARELKKMEQDYGLKIMEHNADKEKFQMVKDMFEGPLGKTLEKIGGAGADRVRGTPEGASKVKAVQTNCPTCQKNIWVDENADFVVCPSCGSTLEKKIMPAGETPAPATPGGQPSGQPVTEPPTLPEAESNRDARGRFIKRSP